MLVLEKSFNDRLLESNQHEHWAAPCQMRNLAIGFENNLGYLFLNEQHSHQ